MHDTRRLAADNEVEMGTRAGTWIGLWTLLTALLLAGQVDAVELRSYRVERYTATQGLSTESLLHAAPLADGRILLVGTRGEPLLFDGYRFAPPPYPRSEAAAFDGGYAALEAPNGDLWVSSMRRGLTRIRGGSVLRVPLPEGMRPVQIRLSPDGSRLLVTSQQGLHALSLAADPPVLQPLASGRALLTALEDADGRIWAAGVGGLFRVVEGVLQPVDPRLTGVHVWTLALDRDGRLLVGTRGLGLVILDRDGRLSMVGLAEGLPNSVVRGIAVTDDGLWLATAGGGLARLRGERVEVLDSSRGLSSDTVTGVVADRKGVLWATTAGAGLNRLWPGPLTTFSDARGRRGGFHYALHRDPAGTIWVGSNQGLSRLIGDQLEPVGAPGPGQASTVVSIVDAPGGGLWLGTRVGVYHYRDGAFAVLPDTVDWVQPLLWSTPPDPVHVATGDRLYQLDGTGHAELLTRLPARNPGRDADGANWIGAIGRDPQLGLLLGSQRGAWAWRGGRLEPVASGAVTGFWRDGERLWLSGLPPRLHTPEGERTLALEADGLGAATVLNVWPDRYGGVWLTSADGLWRLERASLRALRADAVLPATRLGLTEGLPATEFEAGPQQLLPLADGSLLLASTGGISRLDPAALGAAPPALQLRMHAIEGGEGIYTPSPDLALPPGTRRVALSYAVLPASHSAGVRVSYRLLPVETRFRSDRGRREAVYAALGPGEYQLELKAELPGLLPAGAQLSYAFRIEPRPIERRSVQIGAGLALLLAILLLPALRIRALRAQRNRLEAAVAERTAALEALARTDALTGLLNRRSFDYSLARLRERGQPYGLVLTDVDHFKRYNDSLGHQAGDHCLKTVAATLRRIADARNDGSVVARIGGEEFAVLAPTAGATELGALAETLRTAVAEQALPHPAAPLGRVSISLGATQAGPDEAADTLIQRADTALYRAKSGGRDRVVVV